MAVKLREADRLQRIWIACVGAGGERGNNRVKVIKIQMKKGVKTALERGQKEGLTIQAARKLLCKDGMLSSENVSSLCTSAVEWTYPLYSITKKYIYIKGHKSNRRFKTLVLCHALFSLPFCLNGASVEMEALIRSTPINLAHLYRNSFF